MQCIRTQAKIIHAKLSKNLSNICLGELCDKYSALFKSHNIHTPSEPYTCNTYMYIKRGTKDQMVIS